MGTSNISNNTYDFIIVGSGAGGGPLACNLAKKKFRVLLIEAGGRDLPDASEIPAFHALASEDASISWEYFVRHYSDAAQNRRDSKWKDPNGIFYPRASGVGGCTLHNAMITMSGPADDWDAIAGLTADRSWNSDRMRAYFQRVENCRYVRRPGENSSNPIRRVLDWIGKALLRARVDRGRHGFGGWLDTVLANPRLILPDRLLLANILGAFWATRNAQLVDLSLLVRGFFLGTLGAQFDPNHWQRLRDRPEGIALVPMAVRDGRRRSVRDFVLETEQALPQYLTIWTDTVVTEVLFRGESTEVAGVRYLRG